MSIFDTIQMSHTDRIIPPAHLPRPDGAGTTLTKSARCALNLGHGFVSVLAKKWPVLTQSGTSPNVKFTFPGTVAILFFFVMGDNTSRNWMGAAW